MLGYATPLVAASAFPSIPPFSYQMGYGTLLSERFEFPRPLAAADRTQFWVKLLFSVPGQRRDREQV
jgi:hypothetical protein